MKHLPYEEWLLDDALHAGLAQDERQALEQHLQTCDDCLSLARSWQDVALELRRQTEVTPKPGFSQRWQARLERERRRQHRRQSLAVLSFSMAGSALLLGSLVLLAWPYLRTPSLAAWTLLYNLVALSSLVGELETLLGSLLHSFGGTLPLGAWILLTGMLCEMAVLWFVSFRWLTQPRRVAQ